jgi:hypothetical protein
MPTRSIRSSVPSRMTKRLAPGRLDRLAESHGQGGQDVKSLADVAEHRRRADPETAGQIGVGLAIAQVRNDQQGC